ncbi:MAG TPA: O-antigen ligase family protein [Planctomycetaceae bacterium]|jgi:tetratricopeptide (TPR) repeat protein|nr:O-antigen ligase family protein [Planctomycetaceae bacterium]
MYEWKAAGLILALVFCTLAIMSNSKRTTVPQSVTLPRGAPPSTNSDPPAAVLRTLVIGLILVRWLIPAESAGAGDTLWIVQLDFAALILWACSRLRAGNHGVRCSLFDCALWALVAAHCFSAAAVFINGGDRRSALNMAWEWVGMGTTFFLLRQTIQTALDARRLAAIAVALAVVLSGLGIMQPSITYRLARREYTDMISELDSLEKNPSANARRLGELQLTLESQGVPTDAIGRRHYADRLLFSNEAFGPFALANTFAGLLLVMLILGGELYRTLPTPRSRGLIAAYAIGFLLLLYCLILTKSRTAWTGLIVAGAVWGATTLMRNGLRLPRRILLRMGLGSVVVVVLFVIAALGKGFDAEVISEAPKSLSYRFQYWNGAAHTVAASPIFGTGPGNFRQHYLKYKLPESSEEIADPHNWLLDLWVSGGILAVASFLACCVLAVPALRKCAPDEARRPEAAEPLSPWTTDLAGPVLGFLFAVAAPVAAADGAFNVWQLGLLPAWIITFSVLRQNLGSALMAKAAVGASALGLMIHLSGAGGIEMPAIVELLLVLTALAFALRGERPEDVTKSARLVIAIGGVGAVLFASLLLTGTLPVFNRRGAIASGQQALFLGRQFDQAERSLLQAAFRDPLSPEPYDKLAEAYFARWRASQPRTTPDYFAKAQDALKEAIDQDPLNPTRYRRKGEFYLTKFARTNDPVDAKAGAKSFERAIEIYPTDAALRGACATALSDAGNSAEAKTQAAKALELDEINHRWRHTDRYLPEATLARLRRLAASRRREAAARGSGRGEDLDRSAASTSLADDNGGRVLSRACGLLAGDRQVELIVVAAGLRDIDHEFFDVLIPFRIVVQVLETVWATVNARDAAAPSESSPAGKAELRKFHHILSDRHSIPRQVGHETEAPIFGNLHVARRQFFEMLRIVQQDEQARIRFFLGWQPVNGHSSRKPGDWEALGFGIRLEPLVDRFLGGFLSGASWQSDDENKESHKTFEPARVAR